MTKSPSLEQIRTQVLSKFQGQNHQEEIDEQKEGFFFFF